MKGEESVRCRRDEVQLARLGLCSATNPTLGRTVYRASNLNFTPFSPHNLAGIIVLPQRSTQNEILVLLVFKFIQFHSSMSVTIATPNISTEPSQPAMVPPQKEGSFDCLYEEHPIPAHSDSIRLRFIEEIERKNDEDGAVKVLKTWFETHNVHEAPQYVTLSYT
jgi:hypothetical protein